MACWKWTPRKDDNGKIEYILALTSDLGEIVVRTVEVPSLYGSGTKTVWRGFLNGDKATNSFEILEGALDAARSLADKLDIH